MKFDIGVYLEIIRFDVYAEEIALSVTSLTMAEDCYRLH